MAKGVSKREFARLDGCSDTLVRRKVKSGHLKAFADGTIDPALAGTSWRERPEQDADTDDDRSETAADAAERIMAAHGREFLDKADAEKVKENYLVLLKQLQYDKEIGAVVPIEDIAKAVRDEYAAVRSRILSISAKIASRAVTMRSADEIKSLMDREINMALEELTIDERGVPSAAGR